MTSQTAAFSPRTSGSLPRPGDLIAMMGRRKTAFPVDAVRLDARVRQRATKPVARTDAAGIDIVTRRRMGQARVRTLHSRTIEWVRRKAHHDYVFQDIAGLAADEAAWRPNPDGRNRKARRVGRTDQRARHGSAAQPTRRVEAAVKATARTPRSSPLRRPA